MNMIESGFKNYIFPTKTVGERQRKMSANLLLEKRVYFMTKMVYFSQLKSRDPVDFSELKSTIIPYFSKSIGLKDFSKLKSTALPDFSELKSCTSVDFRFSRLKSNTSVGLPLYHAKIQRSGGLYHFSQVKSSNSVEFNLITLYHTKVWQFSRTLTLYYAKVHQSSRTFTLYHFTVLKYTVLVDFSAVKCYNGNMIALYRSNVVTWRYSSMVALYRAKVRRSDRIPGCVRIRQARVPVYQGIYAPASWKVGACELEAASWKLRRKFNKAGAGS